MHTISTCIRKREALGTEQGGLNGIHIEIFTVESIMAYISIYIAFDVTLFTVYRLDNRY
jgi:hypothetical protein